MDGRENENGNGRGKGEERVVEKVGVVKGEDGDWGVGRGVVKGMGMVVKMMGMMGMMGERKGKRGRGVRLGK